jgi:hypothetical protein
MMDLTDDMKPSRAAPESSPGGRNMSLKEVSSREGTNPNSIDDNMNPQSFQHQAASVTDVFSKKFQL